jgi:PPK2 family polyphosphate:nucleotide phosphotransferase
MARHQPESTSRPPDTHESGGPAPAGDSGPPVDSGLPVDPGLHRVVSGTTIDLSAWPTADANGFDGNKTAGLAALEDLNHRLFDLQQLLHANGQHRVLVLLQGMDSSGKDGTIKHVFRHVNPMGVRVENFKQPTAPELERDYLWRVHHKVPTDGEIAIFNRSHYEDVLVPRVHRLIPEERWRRRYQHLLAFEQLLADEGTVICKFFLHISRDEQRRRLQERIDNPAKQWKFDHGDVTERRHWDDYQQAYADAIAATATAHAPWWIVPSDRKWYRNLVVSNVLVSVLAGLDMRYPAAPDDIAGTIID